MSPQHAPQRKLRAAFRWIAISLTVIVLTWLVVISWWQVTQRAVNTADAILCLAILPLAILLGIGLVRWRLAPKTGRMPPVSPNPAPATPSDKPAAQALKAVPILGAWGITNLPPDMDEFIESLSERRSRPTPDKILTDSHGYPLLTGRVIDLDTDAIAGILLRMATENNHDNMPDPHDMRDALLRALALLESVLQQAAQNWPLPAASANAPRARDTAAPTLRGAVGAPAVDAATLRLRAKVILSNELTPMECQLTQSYVAARLPMLGISAQNLHVDITTADDDVTALALADEFGRGFTDASRDAIPEALLLLATDSGLCPTIADQWDEQGRLFASNRPHGIMMGEAAFGILLANEAALLEADVSPICRLTPVARARRTDGIQAKSTHEYLSAAIGEALSAARVSGDVIDTVVCDADHRTSRTLESIEAMLEKTPRLDAIENRLAINEACGHLGAASALGVLVAGAAQSAGAARPVLVFNVSHASERAAAVLLPAGDDHAQAQHLMAA